MYWHGSWCLNLGEPFPVTLVVDFIRPSTVFKWWNLIILRQTGEKDSSNDLRLFDFSAEIHAINDASNTKDCLKKRGKKDVELPLFSYESVSATTNNFSDANKLGEGGFGPVYKVWSILLINVIYIL